MARQSIANLDNEKQIELLCSKLKKLATTQDLRLYLAKNLSSMSGFSFTTNTDSILKCARCGEEKKIDDFYTGTNTGMFFRANIPYCKDCIKEIENILMEKTNNNIEDVIAYMCYLSNLIVIKDYIDNTIICYKEDVTGNFNIFEYYYRLVKNYQSTHKTLDKELSFANSNFGGSFFKSFKNSPSQDIIIDSSVFKTIEEEEDDTLSDRRRKILKSKWGEAWEDKSLIWLDKQEKSWHEKTNVPNDSGSASLLKTICILELKEQMAYDDDSDPKDIIKQKREVLSQAQFSPKKLAKTEQTYMDLGSLIKKRENERPIADKDPTFVDIDNLNSVAKIMAGSLSRTAGIDNASVVEFEKLVKDYTFDFYDEEAGDEDES